jgi:hypothetical protein
MQNRLEAIEYYSISADFFDLTEMVINKKKYAKSFNEKKNKQK